MFDKEVMAANLRALRARVHISQEEAAKRAGVGVASIVNYENGQTAPNYETAWRLADLYGVTLDDLGGRKVPAA